MICKICNKTLKNERALRSHIWRSHTDQGMNHLEKIKGVFIGRGGWNKGLTKESDERVKRGRETYVNKIKSGEIKPGFEGKKHTLDTRSKIGLKLSKNNNGGRCKWYSVENGLGHKFNVQGTWEQNFSLYLTIIDNSWIKIGIGDYNHSFKWIDDKGNTHWYTPDFWSPKLKKYFEVKGYWWGKDKRKMELVLEQNNINLELIDRVKYKEYMKKVTMHQVTKPKCNEKQMD